MKKIALSILMIALLCFVPSYPESLDAVIDEYDQAAGVCAADGMSTGVGVSMMGWGLAIIVGITILAVVLHQSTAGTTHSVSSSGGTGSTGTTGTGLGATL